MYPLPYYKRQNMKSKQKPNESERGDLMIKENSLCWPVGFPSSIFKTMRNDSVEVDDDEPFANPSSFGMTYRHSPWS